MPISKVKVIRHPQGICESTVLTIVELHPLHIMSNSLKKPKYLHANLILSKLDNVSTV